MTKQDELLPAAAKVTDIGIALGGLLALSVFFTVFYRYSVTGEHQFSSPLYMVAYYGAPLTLATLLFASLGFPPLHRIRILIALISFTASIYGLELILQSRYASFYASPTPVMTLLADSGDKRKDAAEISKAWGGEIDTRTAAEVIADLRMEGMDAIPIVAPANHLFAEQPDGSIKSVISVDGREVMPLAGVSTRDTLLCNESGRWVDYLSDRRGFNNPDEIWQSGRLEIAALGDSFVHGYCVPRDKSFVALIRRRYPATLNLGIAGDGPLLMLAKLQEFLPRLKPKSVLWFYYEGNDLIDLQRERKSPLLTSYLKSRFIQSALARQGDIDRAIVDEIPRLRALDQERRTRRLDNRFASELATFTRLAVLRQRLGLIGGMDAGDRELAADLEGPNMGVFREVLVQAKARVNDWGGRLYLVYLPEWARYTSHTSWGKTKRDDVLTLVRDLAIPIVDIDRVFQQQTDPLSLFPFRAVGHYNEAGHRLVAQEVIKAIQ